MGKRYGYYEGVMSIIEVWIRFGGVELRFSYRTKETNIQRQTQKCLQELEKATELLSEEVAAVEEHLAEVLRSGAFVGDTDNDPKELVPLAEHIRKITEFLTRQTDILNHILDRLEL